MRTDMSVLERRRAAELHDTTLPSGWTSIATVAGCTSTISGGRATASGAHPNVMMSFTVNNSNELIAGVNDGGLNVVYGTATTRWIAAPHAFRIEFPSTATFYRDGVQKYMHAFTTMYGSTYRPQLSELQLRARVYHYSGLSWCNWTDISISPVQADVDPLWLTMQLPCRGVSGCSLRRLAPISKRADPQCIVRGKRGLINRRPRSVKNGGIT